MKIACIQINPTVGAIQNNIDAIIEQGLAAQKQGADIIVFPEMVAAGYPPEDLIEREDINRWVAQGLEKIRQAAGDSAWILGHPTRSKEGVFNSASVYHQQQLIGTYHKQQLPNYDVFDDYRNFLAGQKPFQFEFRGQNIVLLICEDLWHGQTIEDSVNQSSDFIISLNASPFELGKLERRKALLSEIARRHKVGVIYCNLVGGQDDLVFDGCSLYSDPEGEMLQIGQAFSESAVIFDTELKIESSTSDFNSLAWPSCEEQWIYDALVLGTRDYVKKNGFKGALLGLSGGIDSALTLCVAADAIGAENVRAVMMPYKYTAQMSVEDAKKQAETLGVQFDIISIQPGVEAFLSMLEPIFKDGAIAANQGTTKDTTEENLQARTRGVTLMAMSNKMGSIVLTTGNKSEMAVGYATLYGDMAGGFAVLKDVLKTKVYKISQYLNRNGEIIPDRVITRPPSAELAPDQIDQDSLPDYDVLDRIIEGYVEQDLSYNQLIEQGVEPELLKRMQRLIDINEYKRRQSAPGPKVSPRAFGRERRFPITSDLKNIFSCG
jgi:NAD+ synthase (glutamine-hydrolysing)